MSLGRRFLAHFDLGFRPCSDYKAQSVIELPGHEEPDPGPGARLGSERGGHRFGPVLYTLFHYLCLVLGVMGKFFIEAASGDGQVNWVSLASAAILSAVVFPYVYRKVCDPRHPNGMQFFVSFQHGFFIQTVLEQVQRLT